MSSLKRTCVWSERNEWSERTSLVEQLIRERHNAWRIVWIKRPQHAHLATDVGSLADLHVYRCPYVWRHIDRYTDGYRYRTVVTRFAIVAGLDLEEVFGASGLDFQRTWNAKFAWKCKRIIRELSSIPYWLFFFMSFPSDMI